jgi:hypothetical protein
VSRCSLSVFRPLPSQVAGYRTAVSLHSHTNHSRETLQFISKFAAKYRILQWAFDRECKKSKIPVDFPKLYWTPPLPPKLAYEVERDQIENVLGLASLVSLTDHDSISAPSSLRALPETANIPLALEWTVPYGRAVFHLGIHNLPDSCATEITGQLAAYTNDPSLLSLRELLATLDQLPDVFIVFNHPLWDLNQLRLGYRQVVAEFLKGYGSFIHAFEINGTRGWGENSQVIEMAESYRRPIVSGGDRHGCEPSVTLNLTRAETFPEFVQELRSEHRSNVLLMPQYAEPRCAHVARELLDTIREYPEYPVGSRRWDDRVFHPSPTAPGHCAISTLWKRPPAFIELLFSALTVLDNTLVQRALTRVMHDETHTHLSEIGFEATL